MGSDVTNSLYRNAVGLPSLAKCWCQAWVAKGENKPTMVKQKMIIDMTCRIVVINYVH